MVWLGDRSLIVCGRVADVRRLLRVWRGTGRLADLLARRN